MRIAALLPILAWLCGLHAWPLSATAAEADRDFYKGRQVRVVIGSTAGGANDLYVRIVIQHLAAHLPGNPLFIPENMPGASSRVAANWLYNIAPRDGSVIGNFSESAPIDQARKDSGILYDAAKFGWIGNPLTANLSILAWADSGLTSMEEVKRRGGLICGGNAGTPGVINPQILQNLTGADIRIISGYKSNPDVGMAMQRGEVNCLGASSVSAARILYSSQMADQKLAFLVQFGVFRDPQVSAFAGRDVPLISDFAKTDADRNALNFLDSAPAFGRMLVTPPGVPSERVEMLRAAFDATMKDADFLADATRQKMDINPVAGPELQRLAATVAEAPGDVVARANELMKQREPGNRGRN